MAPWKAGYFVDTAAEKVAYGTFDGLEPGPDEHLFWIGKLDGG